VDSVAVLCVVRVYALELHFLCVAGLPSHLMHVRLQIAHGGLGLYVQRQLLQPGFQLGDLAAQNLCEIGTGTTCSRAEM
jgi:hypothetical protein